MPIKTHNVTGLSKPREIVERLCCQHGREQARLTERQAGRRVKREREKGRERERKRESIGTSHVAAAGQYGYTRPPSSDSRPGSFPWLRYIIGILPDNRYTPTLNPMLVHRSTVFREYSLLEFLRLANFSVRRLRSRSALEIWDR